MMIGIPFSKLLTIVLSLMCVLLGVGHIGCIGATDSGASTEERTGGAVLGRDFKMKYGQELTVKGHDLHVKFTALRDDSRCPANVTCVWEGNATILMLVRQANAEESQMELHTSRKFPQEGQYQQYVIRLVALDPYPRTHSKIKQSEYMATLQITKE